MNKKKVTLSIVAKETGFSVATVSHVINKTRYVDEKTRTLILKTLKKMNYTGRLSENTKRPRLIGMIIADIREDFFTELVKAAEWTALENGYSLILCDSEDDENKEKLHLNALNHQNISGIIMAPINSRKPPSELKNIDIPIICVDRKFDESPYDFIGINNREAGKAATEYLVKKGASNIGFVGYDDSVYTVRERIIGYKTAMRELNKKDKIDVLRIRYHQDQSLKKIIKFIKDGKDGIICATSHACFETINAIKELDNKLIKKIKIITFDENKWFVHMNIPLYVIRQPAIDIGTTAVELMVNKIKNNHTHTEQKAKNISMNFEITKVGSR